MVDNTPKRALTIRVVTTTCAGRVFTCCDFGTVMFLAIWRAFARRSLRCLRTSNRAASPPSLPSPTRGEGVRQRTQDILSPHAAHLASAPVVGIGTRDYSPDHVSGEWAIESWDWSAVDA